MIGKFSAEGLKSVHSKACFACCLLFLLTFQSYVQASDALRLVALRTIGDSTHTRIIANFNNKPNARTQILDRPARLIINLPTVDFSKNTSLNKKSSPSDMISDVKYGFFDMKTSRIVLTSKVTFAIKRVTEQKLRDGSWQLLIDISQSTQGKNHSTFKNKENFKKNTEEKSRVNDFRVVLDSGHGGIDSGALGITGILEKDITLAFAHALRNELKKYPHITVALTRDSDIFLRLSERVKKAQEFNADLFVSIHADSIDASFLRGATVYTISDEASDMVAKSLAENENKVDLLDGLPAEEFIEITDILIDLTQRETHAFSVNFANLVISNLLKSRINLINNPHRYGDFRVLKAPDVPSVLIEIGYLSNKEDEQLLNSSEWRKQMAASIADSIRQFAEYKQKMMQPP
ncbi:N-acetylmuramoyl-L-alanine amidase [Bartonella sp. CB178]|uniref:N-acetylmuramoyl-L-alanine amidase n=1 Tax=Bartonella sp. CB178 TaxID=3112255 RepID=UPI00300E5035